MIVVEFLLSKGARTDIKDNDGGSFIFFSLNYSLFYELFFYTGAPLHNAAAKGRKTTYFMINEIPLDSRMMIIGDIEVVKLLVGAGADAEQRDADGATVRPLFSPLSFFVLCLFFFIEVVALRCIRWQRCCDEALSEIDQVIMLLQVLLLLLLIIDYCLL